MTAATLLRNPANRPLIEHAEYVEVRLVYNEDQGFLRDIAARKSTMLEALYSEALDQPVRFLPPIVIACGCRCHASVKESV